jgi:hypothetical protein
MGGALNSGRLPPRGRVAAILRRMFADIEADAYVMVDDGAAYDAPKLPSYLSTGHEP